jgi:hypothetical protein
MMPDLWRSSSGSEAVTKINKSRTKDLAAELEFAILQAAII